MLQAHSRDLSRETESDTTNTSQDVALPNRFSGFGVGGIDNSIGESIQKRLPQLKQLERANLVVKSHAVRVPL